LRRSKALKILAKASLRQHQIIDALCEYFWAVIADGWCAKG
jgi:hypothetical protein